MSENLRRFGLRDGASPPSSSSSSSSSLLPSPLSSALLLLRPPPLLLLRPPPLLLLPSSLPSEGAFRNWWGFPPAAVLSLEGEPISTEQSLHPRKRRRLRRSPVPLGIGTGGLLPQLWARPPRRRPRSRTPLCPSAEEPAPRRPLLGPTRESALGSLG